MEKNNSLKHNKIIHFICLFLVVLLCFYCFYGCKKNNNQQDDDTDKGNLNNDKYVWDDSKDVFEIPTGDGAFNENYSLIINTQTEGIVLHELTSFAEIQDGYFVTKQIDPESDEIRHHKFNGTVFTLNNVNIPRARLKFTLTGSISAIRNIYDDTAGEIRVYDSEGKAVIQLPVCGADFESANVEKTFSVYGTNYSDIQNGSVAFLSANYDNVVTFKIKELKIEAVSEDEFAEEKAADVIKPDEPNEIDYGYNPDVLYYMNVRDYIGRIRDTKLQYDIFAMITTIQGLVNRTGAHFYIIGNGGIVVNGLADEQIDITWYNILRREGGILEGKEIVTLKSLYDVLTVFADFYKGLVVWDENVPATSLTAATACGADDLIAVRYNSNPDSLMNVLRNEYEIPVAINLNGKFTGDGGVYKTQEDSTGSKKCDAYIWAIVNYLEAGKTNPLYLADNMDAFSTDYEKKAVSHWTVYGNYYLPQRDFNIMKKAFFFDLSAMPYDAPNDDPNQPLKFVEDLDPYAEVSTDFITFNRILKYCNLNSDGAPIRVDGYVPFQYKYAEHYRYPNYDLAYADVKAENAFAILYGYYNAYKIVDDTGLSNVSVYSTDTVNENVYQTGNTERYKTAELENKNYIYVYMGDFDAVSWVNNYMLQFFTKDNGLGDVPVSFALNLGALERIPTAYNYYFELLSEMPEEKRENVYWVSGNNGFAYGNYSYMESEFRPSGLIGDVESATEYAANIFKNYGIDIMGFFIGDIKSERMVNALAKSYPMGICVSDVNYYNDPLVTGEGIREDGVGVIHTQTFAAHSEIDTWTTVATIRGKLKLLNNNEPNFVALRAVLTSPSSISNLAKRLETYKEELNAEIVDPYTFFELYRQYLAQSEA